MSCVAPRAQGRGPTQPRAGGVGVAPASWARRHCSTLSSEQLGLQTLGMAGPPKQDLFRAMARLGRNLDPAGALRAQRTAASRYSTRTPGVAARRARRHRLGRYARLTLEKLAPFWDGALRVFSPSTCLLYTSDAADE